MTSKKEKILVATIQCGKTSAYAFSYKQDYKKDPSKVSLNPAWNDGIRLYFQQPTCVLCKPNGTFHSFGYDAENKYASLAEDNDHTKWYFFKRFEMVLYTKQIKQGTQIEDDKGLKMPARKVFGMAICHLKNHMLEMLSKQGTGLKVDDIHWVLTVPAISTVSAKQFMREAAKEAGIDGGLLTIVLEPEAAAMYCQLLSDYGFSNMGRFIEKKYMVIDLGDEKTDITVLEQQTIRAVYSEVLGSLQVDERFRQMIIKIFGAQVFKTFCAENKVDYIEMLREFEIRKIGISTDTNAKVTLKIPVTLKDTYEESSCETIKDAIEQTQYRGKIQWTADKMRLDPELFRNLFHDCISSITNYISDLLDKPDIIGTTALLLVGEFAACRLLQEAIRTAFPKLKIVIPCETGLAVLKGAVIFGHTPRDMSSRIAKYSYGINILPPFDPAKHPQDKKVTIGGNARCKDVFKKYIEVGVSIKIGEARIGKHVTIGTNQKEMLLKVYASTSKNPIFVTDPSCEMLGRMVVKIPDTTDPIQVNVKMMFGETELMVEAEEETMREKFVAYFEFL